MGRQEFRYFRCFAKSIGLVFALAGVLIFIVQFLPTYTGKGVVLWMFIGGGILWGLDTFWGTLDDVREIAGKINEHRRP